jgi:predicted site-specific integrase-resolvase
MANNDAVLDRDNRFDGLPGVATIDELCAYLQISPFTLQHYRRRGTGPLAHKLGKHVRYYKQDVIT